MLAQFKRGRDKKKRKTRTSYAARLFGPNRAKYTDSKRNMRLARQAYLRGEPGLLEKSGIIRNGRPNRNTPERNMQLARQAYLQGEPGLLEKWGIIRNRRANMSGGGTLATFSTHYTRTRNGRREFVHKSKNRLKVVSKGKKLGVAVRASVPIKQGEGYVLGVASLKGDKRNIREKFRITNSGRGVGYMAQGNLGPYQAKARGYIGYNPKG